MFYMMLTLPSLRKFPPRASANTRFAGLGAYLLLLGMPGISAPPLD